MLKHILSDINYLLGKGKSCSFGGDEGGSTTFQLSINNEYKITLNSKEYTICVISIRGTKSRRIYTVRVTSVPIGENLGKRHDTEDIQESEITNPVFIGPCDPIVKKQTKPVISDPPSKKQRTNDGGAGPSSALSVLGMDPPRVNKWSLEAISRTFTHSLESYNNISLGTILQMFILNEVGKYKAFTGIIIGIYQRDTEINILILFDDGDLWLIDFNLIIFRNKLIQTHNQKLLIDYAEKTLDKSADSPEVIKFKSIRGPYINPRNIIRINIDPLFLLEINTKIIKNGEIERKVANSFKNNYKKKFKSYDNGFDKVINTYDETQYKQFIDSRSGISITLPDKPGDVEDLKLAILLDQWKDFIEGKEKYSNPKLKKQQTDILLTEIKKHIKVKDDYKEVKPKEYTENIMKKLGVASYTLINIYTWLNIKQNTWATISEKFLKALIILTRTGELNKLFYLKDKSDDEIILVLNTILNENRDTELCIAVDALSGLANFGPLLNAMGNRYRIFMSPVNFADGAMSEDALTKTSLPYDLVDDFSFLKEEIKIQMPGLLDFTFKNVGDDFLKYKLFIEKFGIVSGCGEKEPDPVSGKYTIQNSIQRFEVILKDLEATPNDIKLIIKDLCEKSSKTIMDMSKSIVFKEYITHNRGNNYTFYGNDNSSTLFAKYFLKELSSVVYLGGTAELAKSGLGKFKIVFTIDEARQLFGLGIDDPFPEISSMFDEIDIPFTTPNITIDRAATISASKSGGSGSTVGIQDDDMGVSSEPKDILTIEEFKPMWDRFKINYSDKSEILQYFKKLFSGNPSIMFERFFDLIKELETRYDYSNMYPNESNYTSLIFNQAFKRFFQMNYPNQFGKKIKKKQLNFDKDINYLINLKK
jgi:hypothetical protein